MDNKWETEERKQKGQAGCDNVYGGVSVCHCIHYFSAALNYCFSQPISFTSIPSQIIIYRSINAWVKCTALAHDMVQMMNHATRKGGLRRMETIRSIH